MQICEKCGNHCYDNDRYCFACGDQIKNPRQLRCDYCGSVIAESEGNVCPYCGAKTAFDLLTVTDQMPSCGCCGKKLAPAAKYCGMCGTQTLFGIRERSELQQKRRKRNVTAITLTVTGIIVIGISVIVSVILHDERVARESEEARRSSYAARSESESRQEAEWAEAAKTAEYTRYTAQELTDKAEYIKVGDYVEVTGKLITRYHGVAANNLEITATEENEGKGEINLAAYDSEMGDKFADGHAFGETVTLRGRVSNIYPTIRVVWVTWYEDVTE